MVLGEELNNFKPKSMHILSLFFINQTMYKKTLQELEFWLATVVGGELIVCWRL
jgi:hypothetical protein